MDKLEQINPMREMTVGEYLDRAIEDGQRRTDGLRELRAHLPTIYLQRGCSGLAQALQLKP